MNKIKTKTMIISDFEKLTPTEQENYLGKGIRFDRIRRVTGYLNPDVREWNDGKQAELAMRRTHSVDF